MRQANGQHRRRRHPNTLVLVSLILGECILFFPLSTARLLQQHISLESSPDRVRASQAYGTGREDGVLFSELHMSHRGTFPAADGELPAEAKGLTPSWPSPSDMQTYRSAHMDQANAKSSLSTTTRFGTALNFRPPLFSTSRLAHRGIMSSGLRPATTFNPHHRQRPGQ
ncbi:hypothetical protein F5X68DRAFT_77006 [Plectosphaerella plurivora]|uniref:Uncharacterized protein n=1 Tax=Plectosphaerella plurivora TaxID=936078 RepID=A0A9P8VDP8_9PEZI|nr:hypothetical protein F5X68DRAFT_77006 [Plectosphaerella plurivora]